MEFIGGGLGMGTDSNRQDMVMLVEHEAKEILHQEGIPVPCGMEISELPHEIRLRFPVALKVSDSRILHKSDVGGVRLNLGQKDLETEFQKMKEKFPGSSFLIEEMLPRGIEFIIGVVRDGTFGHVIMLGAGGIYTELYHDVAFRKIPISLADAGEMLEEIKSNRFCTGFRGMRINCAALKQMLVSVSNLVSKGKHVIETMDLNPVIVTSEDALVADAKMSVRAGKSGP